MSGRTLVTAGAVRTIRQHEEMSIVFLRIDRLALELPMAEDPDPESAKVVQELFGGRFGEMST